MNTPIIPENITDPVPGYTPDHWNYPRRCADVEKALTAARERIEEWDASADAHGWWHERPDWIALYNEVLRLRDMQEHPDTVTIPRGDFSILLAAAAVMTGSEPVPELLRPFVAEVLARYKVRLEVTP